MRRLLALLCLLSAAAITAEARFGVGGATRADAVSAAPAGAAKRAVSASPDRVDQWVGVALSRPLFAPDRRPAAGSDVGLPRLAGVIASGTDRVAIFQPGGQAKPMPVRRGEAVGGWDVTTIDGDSVGLRKGGVAVLLRPVFGNLAVAARAPDGPVSRWDAAAPTGVLRARWSNPQLQP